MADFQFGQKNSQTLRRYWWRNETDVHEDVIEAARYLKHEQSDRHHRLLRNLRLYGNIPISGLNISNYYRTTGSKQTGSLTLNVVKTMVDTMANRISKNEPLPSFLTDGGSFDQQTKAKRLKKFMSGVFAQHEMYELGKQVFKDAEIFGTGVIKTYEKDLKLSFDRVFPGEIFIDEEEAFYGHPRQMFQEKFMAREVVLELYPEFEGQILMAGKLLEKDRGQNNASKVGDNISIIEAWHLPSSEEAEDGRHVIVIEGATLFDEKWEKDHFPFSFIHYTPPVLGFWGTGLVDELVGIQVEMNKILRTIQQAMHLLSIPKVFVDASSKIVKTHFNNEIGGIITFSGQKPIVEAFNAVSPELFSHLDRLYQRAFEITGISQLQAQGLKPEGLDSGKAIRTFNDIQTERFILNGQLYERLFLDIAEKIISVAKDISKQDRSFGTMAIGKRNVEKIKFSEVDLDRDRFSMKMFPVSALSETPSARLQEVQEITQAGFIDRESAIQLLNFPDLENVYNEITSRSEIMDLIIDKILQRGRPEFVPPDPLMPLEFGLSRMKDAYLRGKINNVPDERLNLMMQWIIQAEQLLTQASQDAQQQAVQQAAAAAQQGGGQQGPLPNARPETTPQSDLIPQNTPAVQQLQEQGLI